jgi:hypothetical protein
MATLEEKRRNRRERTEKAASKRRVSNDLLAGAAVTANAPPVRGQESLEAFMARDNSRIERRARKGSNKTRKIAESKRDREDFPVSTALSVLRTSDPARVARESELEFMRSREFKQRVRAAQEAFGVQRSHPPRAKGSEQSFSFESVDSKGRKTIRFSDKPEKKKGERKIR